MTEREEWCDVMDMAKAGCAHCRPPAERRRLAAAEEELKQSAGSPRRLRDVGAIDPDAGSTLIAVSATRCPRCRELVWPGDVARVVPDGIVHDFCVRIRRPRRPKTSTN